MNVHKAQSILRTYLERKQEYDINGMDILTFLFGIITLSTVDISAAINDLDIRLILIVGGVNAILTCTTRMLLTFTPLPLVFLQAKKETSLEETIHKLKKIDAESLDNQHIRDAIAAYCKWHMHNTSKKEILNYFPNDWSCISNAQKIMLQHFLQPQDQIWLMMDNKQEAWEYIQQSHLPNEILPLEL